jgi:hypothetical protein
MLFGETATRIAVRVFLVHYHTEKSHQCLGNELDVLSSIETTACLGGFFDRKDTLFSASGLRLSKTTHLSNQSVG